MDYLERLPRRLVTLYLPLGVFLFVLLFPFYWMTTTTFKPDAELYDYKRFNPFWVHSPTLEHIHKLFFETSYPSWLDQHDDGLGGGDGDFARSQRLRRLCDRAPAVSPARATSGSRSFSPIWCRRASCSFRSRRSSSSSACSTATGR